jgi:hypothetical protein
MSYSCDGKDWKVRTITASSVICTRPGYIKTLIIDSTASQQGTVYIIDGQGYSTSYLVNLSGRTGEPIQFSFDIPLYCNQGIYIYLSGYVTSVTVMWLEKKR